MVRTTTTRPAATLLVFAMLLLSACSGQGGSGGSNGEVNLRVTVWTPNEEQLAAFDAIGKAFVEEHSDVDSVRFETIPFDDYSTVLATQLSGGNAPDLGWIFETNAPEFVESGVLADVGPVLREDPAYEFDDIVPSTMELWQRGEKVYAYPFSTSPFAVFYNADLLKAAGQPTPTELVGSGAWTWDEVGKVAAAVAEQQGVYGLTEHDFDYKGWDFLAPIWRGFGADPWSDDGTTCTLDSPEMVQAMQFLHGMIFTDESFPGPGTSADFFAGEVAMTISQISKVTQLADVSWEWGVAPLPQGPAGDVQVVGQAGIGVFEQSKHPEQAAELLKFMTNQENSAKLAQFFPPPRKSLLNAETLAESNPLLSPEQLQTAVIDSINKGTPRPSHPKFSKLREVIRAALDPLWKPNADVEAVLRSACEAAAPHLGTS